MRPFWIYGSYLKELAVVGFEPTPPERLEPKSSALDHSATLPYTEPFCVNPVSQRRAIVFWLLTAETRRNKVQRSACRDTSIPSLPASWDWYDGKTAVWHCDLDVLNGEKGFWASCLAEDGFDPSTSGLWAQHASAAPLCFTLPWMGFELIYPLGH